MTRHLPIIGVLWLLVFWAATAVPAAAAALVVLESSDPALAPGTVVTDGRVTVAPGARVVFLDEAGRTSMVDGPHDGPVPDTGGEPAGHDRLSLALRRMVADGATSSATLGAVRATETSADLPSGGISAAHTGVQCHHAGGVPLLVREAAGPEESAVLKSVGGMEAVVVWPRGQAAVEWPARVALTDGGTFLLRRDGRSIPFRIDLRVLEGAGTSDAYLAVRAASLGCRLQADAALARMAP